MANDVLIYRPSKKEPSIFNINTFIGAMIAGSSPAGFIIGAIIGGTIGYYEERYVQEHGIRVKKPDGNILNGSAIAGAVLFGIFASTFLPVGATMATAATIVGLGAAAGGLLVGWSSNRRREVLYDLALKQENERQASVSADKSVSQYKNIPDLPEIPERTKENRNIPFTEQIKSTGQYSGAGITDM